MCSQLIIERSDGTKPLEVLEREITTLASQIHAATCRWLGLVAEYDAREGWAQWGCKSCAHWVAWQCGIAPGALGSMCEWRAGCRSCRSSARPSRRAS